MSSTALEVVEQSAHAKLPVNYEQAKTALANVEKIDECKDWADRAAALASYARQAKDDALVKMSMRIQGRAIRRCGELLKQVDGRGNNQHQDGAVPKHKAASAAGLSERQRKTALNVANVPEQQFEEMVEAETPATVTKLAQAGKQPNVPDWYKPPADPDGFNAQIHLRGAIKRLREQVGKFPDMPRMVAAMEPADKDACRGDMMALSGPLSTLMSLLGE